MEVKEQEICRELEQVNEETQTIENRQQAAQATLRARQKEKQKVRVRFYHLYNLYKHHNHNNGSQ